MAGNTQLIAEKTPDGVFITIKNPPSNPKQVKGLILKCIEDNNIKSVDIKAVQALITGVGQIRRELVSSDVAANSLHEDVSLEVSHDSLQGHIYFTAPSPGGRLLSEAEIKSYLDNKGIVYGVDPEKLAQAINERKYGKKYLIAQGLPVSLGSDGKLKYLFDLEAKKMKPVILANGNVDYYNVENFELAKEGQVLVRVVPDVQGEDGLDIYGRTIKCRRSIVAPKLRTGPHVAISHDGQELIATAAGQILFVDNRVFVTQVMEINGDVGVNSGNIDFVGTVKVYGNILSDYSVTAGGNIEVSGMAEGDGMLSGGNVIIAGGITGMNKSVVEAAGNVSAKFIANTQITAGGNVYCDNLLRCNIKCKGVVELQGKRGLVSGGSLMAKKGLSAQMVGSPMSTPTKITVGVDYELYERYTSLRFEYKTMTSKYNEMTKNIEFIERQKAASTATKERMKELLAITHARNFCKESLDLLKLRLAQCVKMLKKDTANSYIKVSGTMYPGVNIQIGNAVMLVKDEMYNSIIVNEKDLIVIKPLDKEDIK